MRGRQQGSTLIMVLVVGVVLALLGYLLARVLTGSQVGAQARAVQSGNVSASRARLMREGHDMVRRAEAVSDRQLSYNDNLTWDFASQLGAASQNDAWHDDEDVDPNDILCLRREPHGESGGRILRLYVTEDSCPERLLAPARRMLTGAWVQRGSLNEGRWPVVLEVGSFSETDTASVYARGVMHLRSGQSAINGYALMANEMLSPLEDEAFMNGPVHVGELWTQGHVHFMDTVTVRRQGGYILDDVGAVTLNMGLPCIHDQGQGLYCPSFNRGVRDGVSVPLFPNAGAPGGGFAPHPGNTLDAPAPLLVMNGYGGGTEMLFCDASGCAVYRTNGGQLERFTARAGLPPVSGVYSLPAGSWVVEEPNFAGIVAGEITEVRALGGAAFAGSLHIQSSASVAVTSDLLAVRPPCVTPGRVTTGGYLPPSCSPSPDMLGISAQGDITFQGHGLRVHAALFAPRGTVQSQGSTELLGSIVGDRVDMTGFTVTHDPRGLLNQAPAAWPRLPRAWPAVLAMDPESVTVP